MAEAAVAGLINAAISAAISIGVALLTRRDQPPPAELDKITVGGSGYGNPIPVHYSIFRVPGNVVLFMGYSSRAIDTGGKGGLFSSNSTGPREYFADIAIAYSDRVPVTGYLKLFFGNNVVYDALTEDPSKTRIDRLNFRAYRGDETEVDPLVLDYFAGDTARAREAIPEGIGYVVYEKLPLSEFGNVIPPSSAIISAQAQDDAGTNLPLPLTTETTSPYSLYLPREQMMAQVDTSGATDELQLTSTLDGTVLLRKDLDAVRTFAELFAASPNQPGQNTNFNGQYSIIGVNGPYIFVGFGYVSNNGSSFADVGAIWVALDRTDLALVYVLCDLYAENFQGVQVGIDETINKLDGPYLDDSVEFARVLPWSQRGTVVRVRGVIGPDAFYLIGGNREGGNFISTRGDLWMINAVNGNYVFGIGATKPNSKLLAICPGIEGDGFSDCFYMHGDGWNLDYTNVRIGRLRIFENARYELGFTFGVEQTHAYITLPATTVRNAARMAYDPTDDALFVQTRAGAYKYQAETGALIWSRTDAEVATGVGHWYQGAFDGAADQVQGANWGVNTGTGVQAEITILDAATGDTIERRDFGGQNEITVNDVTGQTFWDPRFQRTGSAGDVITVNFQNRDRPTGTPELLVDVLADIWARTGAPPDLLDTSRLSQTATVQGYALTELTDGRGALTPFLTAYDFDVIEASGKLTCIPRGGDVIRQVPTSDIIRPSGEDFRLDERASTLQRVPRVTVTGASAKLDYRPLSQTFPALPVDALPAATKAAPVNIPIAVTDQEISDIAARLYDQDIIERNKVLPFRLPHQYMDLRPGDLIALGYRVIRLERVTFGADYTVECEGSFARRYSISPPPTGTPVAPAATDVNDLPGFVRLAPIVIDALVQPAPGAATTAVYYVGIARAVYETSAFRSEAVTLTVRGSSLATSSRPLDSEAMLASVVSPPPAQPYPASHTQFDAAMDVEVLRRQDLMTTLSEAEWYDGGNRAAIVSASGQVEIIAYRRVEDLGDGVYRLRDLTRGLRGTGYDSPAAAGGADAFTGARFVFLDIDTLETVTVALSAIGQPGRAVVSGTGETADERSAIDFVMRHRTLLPLEPVRVSRSDDMSGVTLSWIRQTRGDAEWLDGTDDVPLSEDRERYEIDIRNDAGDVIRTLSSTSPTVLYSDAQVSDDFGSAPAVLDVEIFQIGAPGRGYGARRALNDGETI